MKKLILIIGAFLLLAVSAEAQKDYRARDLEVERYASLPDLLTIDGNIITGVGVDSSSTVWTSSEILPTALAVYEYTVAYVPLAPYLAPDSLQLVPISVAPSAPVLGMMYFDSTDSTLKVYNGISWQSCY